MIEPTIPYINVADTDSWLATTSEDTSFWSPLTSEEKLSILRDSTAIINRLRFRGEKTSSSQINAFPRYSTSVIPQNIMRATVYIALSISEGFSPNIEYTDLGRVSQKTAGISSTYTTKQPAEHVVAGVPSVTAWRLLLPFMPNPKYITL